MSFRRLGIDARDHQSLDEDYLKRCVIHQENYVDFLETRVRQLRTAEQHRDMLTSLLRELRAEKDSLEWLRQHQDVHSAPDSRGGAPDSPGSAPETTPAKQSI